MWLWGRLFKQNNAGKLLQTRYQKHNLIFLWLVLLILSEPVPGQDSLQITNIHPFIRDDTLVCQFAVSHLFSGSIKQTLLSGLPVLIEMQPSLLSNNNRQLTTPKIKYHLTYDIWEDRFAMESTENIVNFTSLSSLKKWWNPYQSLPLFSLKKIKDQPSLQISLKLRLILLSSTQSQKLKDWIFNSEETEENTPAMDRDTGFKLNLNRLVSLFLSKGDIAETFTIQVKSTKFDLERLQREE